MKELITEVDKNDNFLGLRSRSDFYKNRKLIHRSANLLLFNDNNELLIQKRSSNKKWFPGLFDFSASGTVADETYEQCMSRETKEELGVKIEFKKLFKYFHESKIGKAHKVVFIGKCLREIKIDKFEVESVRWINLPNLLNEIKTSPKKFTPMFLEGITRYIKSKENEK